MSWKSPLGKKNKHAVWRTCGVQLKSFYQWVLIWWVARQILCITILWEVINHFSSKPEAVGSKSHSSTEFVFPVVFIDQGRFLIKNSCSSFAASIQEMAVTFLTRKVMYFDRRHRANPSNHAAQTTARCSPEARCSSCCLISFSSSGAERHSEYQKGRKAVPLILWKSSARSNINSRLVI